MDPHVKLCEELFSAARTEFKNMENFYFHNCLYEFVWKDNRRRHAEKTQILGIFFINILLIIKLYLSEMRQ